MSLTYEKRNLENIAKLASRTKEAALEWHKFLVKNDIDVLIYETIRTKEQQARNVAKGASHTTKSYHIVGQALDFVPIVKGAAKWNGYNSPEVKKAIKEAKRLGFTWGADWDNDGKTSDETFVDSPHLQYTYKGYGTDTFGKLHKHVYPGHPLKEGSTNTVAIKVLQNELGLKADGVFGPKTKAAVVSFQKKHGLVQDGTVGERTWNAMF
jgi:peptidoglycan L-alanyl-D-glutamate endopeptidase CwlK